jgi:hypothetical protein
MKWRRPRADDIAAGVKDVIRNHLADGLPTEVARRKYQNARGNPSC